MRFLSTASRLPAIFSVMALAGCATLSSFQEARTVEKGKGRLHIAATDYSALVRESSGFEDPKGAFVFDIGARVGIIDKLDIGLNYSIPASATGDVKYMFTSRESKFAFSSGLKAGYMNYELEFSDSSGTTAKARTPTIIDVGIPLYATVYPLNWLSLTASPHATYRTVIGAWMTAGPILGVNGNLKIGKNGGVLVEGGFHKAMESGGPYFINYSAAVFFPISLGFEDLVKDAAKNL